MILTAKFAFISTIKNGGQQLRPSKPCTTVFRPYTEIMNYTSISNASPCSCICEYLLTGIWSVSFAYVS